MEYKGQLKGMPEGLVKLMLKYQVEQGNKENIEVFEKDYYSDRLSGGFEWSITSDEEIFQEVIKGNIQAYYDKYPENKYPKVMMVSGNPITTDNTGHKRVVFMEKCGKYLVWAYAETLEDAEKEMNIGAWDYAKDIEDKSVPDISGSYRQSNRTIN